MHPRFVICSRLVIWDASDVKYTGSSTTLSAWYEWYPDDAYDFDGISFSVGDTVKVSVTASSDSSGTATVENTSTGKKVDHSFTSGTAGSLCETNAEWIVEDFEEGGSDVPLVNFGTVTFTSCEATKGGSSVDTSGSVMLNMRKQGQVLTSGTASGSEVTIKYTG